VERIESFVLVALTGDDDERRPRMVIAPFSQLFARRCMRHHRIDATLLDELAHRC
jgi:hypothetical protein